MIAITAYYPSSTNLADVTVTINEQLAELASFGLQVGQVTVDSQELAEEDWADNWKNTMNQLASRMI